MPKMATKPPTRLSYPFGAAQPIHPSKWFQGTPPVPFAGPSLHPHHLQLRPFFPFCRGLVNVQFDSNGIWRSLEQVPVRICWRLYIRVRWCFRLDSTFTKPCIPLMWLLEYVTSRPMGQNSMPTQKPQILFILSNNQILGISHVDW